MPRCGVRTWGSAPALGAVFRALAPDSWILSASFFILAKQYNKLY